DPAEPHVRDAHGNRTYPNNAVGTGRARVHMGKADAFRISAVEAAHALRGSHMLRLGPARVVEIRRGVARGGRIGLDRADVPDHEARSSASNVNRVRSYGVNLPSLDDIRVA